MRYSGSEQNVQSPTKPQLSGARFKLKSVVFSPPVPCHATWGLVHTYYMNTSLISELFTCSRRQSETVLAPVTPPNISSCYEGLIV